MYEDVKKPDGKKTIEINANPVQLVTNAFDVWQRFVKKIAEPPCSLVGKENLLLEEAVHILTPIEPALPAIIQEEDYFTGGQESSRATHIGLFYTALLNIGTLERRVVVPRNAVPLSNWRPDFSYWGYKLKKGVLELHAHSKGGLGEEAEGGCIINNGIAKDAHFGFRAKGGLFINNLVCNVIGRSLGNCIFINNGWVTACIQPKKGIYIDLSQSEWYETPEDALLISLMKDYAAPFRMIGRTALEKDKTLMEMVMHLYKITAHNVVPSEVLSHVSKIEEYCKTV